MLQVQQDQSDRLAAAFAALLEERMRAACPVSLAVTLRHYRAVHAALHQGTGGSVGSLVDDVMQVRRACCVASQSGHAGVQGPLLWMAYVLRPLPSPGNSPRPVLLSCCVVRLSTRDLLHLGLPQCYSFVLPL